MARLARAQFKDDDMQQITTTRLVVIAVALATIAAILALSVVHSRSTRVQTETDVTERTGQVTRGSDTLMEIALGGETCPGLFL